MLASEVHWVDLWGGGEGGGGVIQDEAIAIL